MNQLDRKIAGAMQAAQQVAALKDAQEQAEQLPGLLKERAAKEDAKRAEFTLEAAIDHARFEFSASAEKVALFREHVAQLLGQAEALGAEMREVQDGIFKAGRQLKAGAEYYEQTHEKPDADIPDLCKDVTFSNALTEAGATKPELDLLPYDGRVILLLTELMKSRLHYRPKHGSSNWRAFSGSGGYSQPPVSLAEALTFTHGR
jgi:hypothetical protein